MPSHFDRRKEDKKIDEIIEKLIKIEEHVKYYEKEILNNCNLIHEIKKTINGNGRIGIKTEIELLKTKDTDHDNAITALKKDSYDKKQSLYKAVLTFFVGIVSSGVIFQIIANKTP